MYKNATFTGVSADYQMDLVSALWAVGVFCLPVGVSASVNAMFLSDNQAAVSEAFGNELARQKKLAGVTGQPPLPTPPPQAPVA